MQRSEIIAGLPPVYAVPAQAVDRLFTTGHHVARVAHAHQATAAADEIGGTGMMRRLCCLELFEYNAARQAVRPCIPMANSLAFHWPVSELNTSGSGIRSYIRCSCGHMPGKMPESGRAMDSSYRSHTRRLRLSNAALLLPYTVYGQGYPAAGLTWNQWHEVNPALDPFGVREPGWGSQYAPPQA